MTDVNSISADELIRAYRLLPHPEGGYFRETYRSSELIPHSALAARYSGARSYCTAIYYLLPKRTKSRLHRIASDEIWHFYLGGPLDIAEIHPDGGVHQIVLGLDVRQGQRLQHVVNAGVWFGAWPQPGSEFSFVGCTVAPGFDFADFELANPEPLLQQFPHARELIQQLTRA